MTSNKTKEKNKSNYYILTKEEIKEYLKNSILIPKDKWEEIPLNSYISYTKNDGKFVKGGYIKIIFKKKNKKNNDNEDESNKDTEFEEDTFMTLANKLEKYSNDKFFKEFTINLSNIKEIYKKINDSAFIEYQIIKNNVLKLIQDFTKKLEKYDNEIENINKKITKLEDNNYKVLKLIKKLHNIDNIEPYKNKI